MIGVSSSYKNDSNIKVKIKNMKRRERSSSRDSSRYRRKRNRSRYDDSSDERTSPDRIRRHSRVRSPASPHSRYGYEKGAREEHGASRDGEKPHASYKVLCVSALHTKASDDVIKDALYNEYKKFGDLSVRISHDLDERVAYVCFRNSEDAKEAKHAKPRVIIYDKVALVEPVYESRSSVERHRHRSRPRSRSYSPEYDRYYRRSPIPDPYRADRFYDRLPYAPLPMIRDFRRDLPPVPHPEFLPRPPLHPALPVPPHLPPAPHLYVPGPRPFMPFKPPHAHFMDKLEKKDKFPNYLQHIPPEDDPLATRTLFAGNLELSISEEELRRIFNRYGVVEDIDIKRPMPGTGNAYAFVRYKNLDMAHRAKVELSGQYIGKFQCKIGYGKATPTTRIWVGGLGPWTSTTQLEREFDRFGAIKKIDYDKNENSAYILYDSIDAATAAVKEMRGFPLGGSEHKLRVDFADIGSRQPRAPPPPASSYDDVAIGAGDYNRIGSSGADVPAYEPYEPLWNTDYEYDSRPPGIPPGVTLWSERGKNDKDSYGSRTLSSPNDYPKEDDWAKEAADRDYDGHKYKRVRSSCNNSESDSDNRFNGALATATSLADITRCTTNAWQGALILKSSLFPAKFHITDGDGNIINVLMKSDESKHLLRISQRLRLDTAKLEDVSKRIVSSPGYGIFVGLPGPSSSIFFDETTAQCRPLRNLISYLKQKEAAGVISLFNKDTEAKGVLYAFPPCQFAADLLKRTAHAMSAESMKEDHLMIVVVKNDAAA